jgi:two-component system NarL family sensor kinase
MVRARTDDAPRAGRSGPIDRRSAPVSVGALVLRFTVAGVFVTAVIALIIALLARQAGTEQAVESARQVSWVTARGIAEPRLTPEVVAGDPAALTAFNDAMQKYVITGSLVRVKVWDEQGRIIYSDESRLIGQTFALGDEELEALNNQSTDSEISDLTQPENEFERPYEKLLEVYVGVRSTSGQPLLFESYFRYDGVVSAGQAEWRKFAPVALGGLIALQLVQIPFAYSLARRLQRQQRDRARLLQHAVDASDAERRRVAGDLHDGVVQELTGLTFTLDAARLGPPDAQRDADLVRSAAAQLRHTTGQLRSLLVDIYPPSLTEEGLPASLMELASGLERAGFTVDLDVEDAADVSPRTAAVLFRSAQEVLRNIVSHSGAQHVDLRATVADGQATLVVDDDGRGFVADDLHARLDEGHLGLRSLGDLVNDAGGQLTVRSAPGQGTRAEIVMPAR